MPLPYPTTSTRIGIREYFDDEVDARYVALPPKFRKIAGLSQYINDMEEPPCMKDWAKQTYETTNSVYLQHPLRRGGTHMIKSREMLRRGRVTMHNDDIEGVEDEENRATATDKANRHREWLRTVHTKPGEAMASHHVSTHEIYNKAPNSLRSQQLPPVGLVSQSNRSAAHWISRQHETHATPTMEPPVAKTEARLARQPALAPCGTLLEIGEPLRSSTYREHYQAPEAEDLAQHLLRCKTTSSAYRPDAGDVMIAKPKDDPTPLGITYVRGPSGDRQTVELCDASEVDPVDRKTVWPRTEQIPLTTANRVRYNPHLLRSSYTARFTDPVRDHERLVRTAVVSSVAHVAEQTAARTNAGMTFERFTIPRVFTVKDGQMTVDRVTELAAAKERNSGTQKVIPRSKVCTVGDLLQFRVTDNYAEEVAREVEAVGGY